ncbi:MAG: 2-oxo acid dehydrogenase subunit E2 [Actinobacteria bacterium]|nr:2-oxo acid dehydrogenase subunit E2 [Actinomycetota bacterium]
MSKFEYIVIMPKMSMTMEEGDLLEVRVKAGDAVKSGDVLFDVATDKIDMEVESPADGVVAEIIGVIGSTMPVGAPVLKLMTETQVMSFDFNTPTPTPTPEVIEASPPVQDSPSLPEPVVVAIERVALSAIPKARVLAAENGIDLLSVFSSGPSGMITHEDVVNFQRSQQSNPRRVANRKMVAKAFETTRGIPQLTLSRFVGFSSHGQESDLATLSSAWAKVLRKNTHVNISALTEAPNANVGIALVMESKYGLALPVFKNPDQMTHDDLTSLIAETQIHARDGKVPIDMLNGATASIFDLSRTSITSAHPLLMPSHTTALTVGGKNGARDAVELSLTVDLRYCDSLEAADLLDQLVSSL